MAMELAEKIKHDSGVTPEALRPAIITGGGLSLPRYHPKYTLDKFRYTEGYNNFGANLDDEADKVRNSVKKKFDERTLYYGDDDDDVLLNETRANGIQKEEIRETVVREVHTTVAPVTQPDEQSCGDCCNCCCVWLPATCCPCCTGEKMRSSRATRTTREHTREHIRTGGRYDDCFCWRHTCCRSSSGPNDLCSPWYTSMMALSIKLVAVVCLLLLVLGFGLAAGLGALDNIKSTKYDNTTKTTTSVPPLISCGNKGQSTISGITVQPKSASTLSSSNITGNPPLQNVTIPPVNSNNSYTTAAGSKKTTAGNITVAQGNVTNSPTNSILNTTNLALNTTVSSLNNSAIKGLPQNFMSTFGDNIVNTADISLVNSTDILNNIVYTVGAPAPSTSQAPQITTTKNIPIAQVVTSVERNNITSEQKTTAKILETSKAAAATTAGKSSLTTASNVGLQVAKDTTPADIGLDTESVTRIFNFVPQDTTLLAWPVA